MTDPWGQLVPWVIALPFVGAVLTPAIAARRPQLAGRWAWAVVLATGGLAAALVVRLLHAGPIEVVIGGWAAPYGIELRFDRFAAFALPLCLLYATVLPYAWRDVAGTLERSRRPAVYALLLLVLGGMIGFSTTADLFNLFVFTEVTSLAGYALVAVGGRGVAAWAALKYLFLGAVASLLGLFATALLFALTGTLNVADVTAKLAEATATGPIVLAFAAFMASFLLKAAVFPLHVWLPDAHAIAPSPVSAVLSGMVVKLGIVGMLRVLPIFHAADVLPLAAFHTALAWLGAVSIVMGAFLAIFQDDLKLMLAYSTISNVGYIVLGIGLASPSAVIGASVHVVNHALIKVTLFLAAGVLIHQTGFRTLTDLRGAARAMPHTAAAMAIGAVSIVGLPPTAGFVCKWYIALGAFESGQGVFGFALVFGALFIFVYYLRMLNALYFQAPVHREVAEARDPPWVMRGPVLALAAACLVFGVLGGVPLNFVAPAVRALSFVTSGGP